ncbi:MULTISPECIES: helix-turn-helix transcriptional regulator [unclassified Psychrobacillus]|uniref:helix-turn-helix transcriptional regulator n=1 Tax=unclassified Psychrobacillus TaxID=2636677 RepID=UPI0030F8CF32
MKKGRNLLDSTELLKTHPELHELFLSTAAIYGNIIFAKRMELDHTQSELAKLANVSLKTIARAEGGSYNLSTDTYDKIFRALNMTPIDVAQYVLQFSKRTELATVAYAY